MSKDVSLKYYTDLIFSKYLSNSTVTEIAINGYGGVWFENNYGWNYEENNQVNEQNFLAFINALAAYNNQTIDTKNPQLDGILVNKERIKVIIPPACDDNQRIVVIRKPSSQNFSLDYYQKTGFFDDVVFDINVSSLDIKLLDLYQKRKTLDFLKLAISSGTKNIVIAGKTASGKTSFAKSLIENIPLTERLVSIEDTRELISSHKNFVHLLYPSQDISEITPIAQLKNCLRMKPDRILLSELRGGEAFAYIRAISSGHGGSITTLHAGEYSEAIEQICLMFLQDKTGSSLPYNIVKSIVLNTIDIVVCIGVSDGKRKINSITWEKSSKIKEQIEILQRKENV